MTGYTDMPANEDLLGMGAKYDGLTKFICECDTPMTISVNGDWGTGKTSAMNIVQEKLLKDYKATNAQMIWFNTWEFSVVEDKSKLVIELMSEMHRKLCELVGEDENDGKNENIKNIFNVVRAGASFAGKIARPYVDPLDVLLNIIEARSGGADKKSEPNGEYKSMTELVKELNENIEKKIEDAMKKIDGDAPKRLFIFVDDLDRLEPAAALDLLEGMKNFTTFDNCVFILAVDQKVVERGLKSKYGDDFKPEMARKFFDKIIQLPFSLPTRSYDMKQYISKLLEGTEYAAASKQTAEKIAELLKTFDIYNPRTVKRSFNLLHMFRCINRSADTDGDMLKQYAVLLLQMEHESDYDKLNEKVETVYGSEPDKLNEKVETLKTDGENSKYIKAVLKIFYPDTQKEDWSAATEELKKILSYTQSYEANEDNLPAAKYIIKLMKKLEHTAFDSAIIENNDWQQLRRNYPSPSRLSNYEEKDVLIINWKNNSDEIKITWILEGNVGYNFYISLWSPNLSKSDLDEGHFQCLDDIPPDRRDQYDPNRHRYYWGSKDNRNRATIYVNFEDADRVTELIMNTIERREAMAVF